MVVNLECSLIVIIKSLVVFCRHEGSILHVLGLQCEVCYRYIKRECINTLLHYMEDKYNLNRY